ncbi:MAG: autotransporter-associated beta strand repeat-containing protein [Pirellulales bacterium]|nr:autotransporter-associated beta strand repeat-containing protein [Pirellulales bacterium]
MLNFLEGILGTRKNSKRKSCACRGSCTKGLRSLYNRKLLLENLEQRQLLSITWNGQGGNNLWSNDANWVGGVAPTAGADIVFSGSTQTNTQNDLSETFQSITFSSSNFTIGGNSVALTNSITVNSGVVGASIPAGVDFSGESVAVNVGYGSNINLGGAVSNAGDLTLQVSSGSSMTVGSGISGSGGLDVTLGYGSTITVAGGISGSSAVSIDIPSGSSGTINGGLSGIGSLTATEGYGSTLTVGGGIADSGDVAFTVAAGSTLTLGGGITDAGVFTLTEGDGATATVSGAISDVSGMTFDLGSGANATVSGDISGETGLTKTGAGTLALSGHNTFTGTTTISAGTLRLDASDALSGSTLAYAAEGGTLSFGTLTSAALGGLSGAKNLALNNASSQAVALTVGGNGTDTTYSGVLSGSGSLTKIGAGTLSLSGSDTYSGATTISAGALQADDGVGLPAASFLKLDGGVLQSNSTATFSRSLGTSGGTFQWTENGGGFSAGGGPLTVNVGGAGGTLAWGAGLGSGILGTLKFGSPTAAYATTLVNGIDLAGAERTIEVASPNLVYSASIPDNADLSGVLSDSVGGASLTKTGIGLLRLSGSAGNTYTGATTVTRGLLALAKTSGYALPGDVHQSAPSESSMIFVEGDDQIAPTSVVNFEGGYWPHFLLQGHSLTVAGISDVYGTGVIENTQDETGVGNATLTVNNAADYTFGGFFRDTVQGSGTLALVKEGSGTLTLVGPNVSGYTGGTTVNGGTLQFGDGTAGHDCTLPGNAVVNGASSNIAFNISPYVSIAYTGVISGTGNVNKLGYGNLWITGANTFTGDFNYLASNPTLTEGVVFFASATGPAVQGNVNMQGGYWLFMMAADQFGPNSTLTFTAPGEFVLNGFDQTVAGINGAAQCGIIQNAHLYAPYYWGIPYPTTNSALTVNADSDCSYSGMVRDNTGEGGTIGLTKTGSGKLTMTGWNTGNYTGQTDVLEGVLQLGNGSECGAAPLGVVNIGPSGTVRFYQNDTQWIGSLYAGSGNLEFVSAGGTADGYVGDYVLVGDSTAFTGTLTVDDARVRDYTGPENFGSAAIAVLPGGQILAEVADATYTNDITISGTGWLEYPGVSYGALRFGGTTWAGDITLAGDARITAAFGDATVTGNISGDYTLEIGGAGSDGTTVLTPNTANSFAALKVSGGTVLLNGTNANQVMTTIAGGTLKLGISGALPSMSVVQIGEAAVGAGVLDLNGYDLTLSGLYTDPGIPLYGGGWGEVTNSSGVTATMTVYNSEDCSFGGYFSGNLILWKLGDGLLTLTAPGVTLVPIYDFSDRIAAGGAVTVTAQTVMPGMPITLSAGVADPFGDCQGVTFYRDTNGDGQLDAGDTLLGTGSYSNGFWTATVSTVGWGPSQDALFAQAAFDPNSPNPPVSTVATGNLDVTADFAVLSPADQSGYAESGSGFSTAYSANAVGGTYRELSGADPDAYVTYTFTGLSPGNYEIWTHYIPGGQYSAAVPVTVYDGDPATGTLQQTFYLNETALHWSNWEFAGDYGWNWSDDYFYSNSGTITVRVGVGEGGLTQAPAVRLIDAPVSSAPNGPCSITSNDPIDYATGQIKACNCAGALPEGTEYDNTAALYKSDTGYGYSDIYTPEMFGAGSYVKVWNANDECSDDFLEPVRHYTALYGSKSTLEEIDSDSDGDGDYLLYTSPNGTACKFIYPDQEEFAIGQWYETTTAGGEVNKVTSWVNDSGTAYSSVYDAGNYEKKYEVQYATSAYTHAYKRELYTYITDDQNPNYELRDTLTYQNWDPDANSGSGGWVDDYKIEYTYYVTGANEHNGTTGDLKTVTTTYWDSATSDWATVGETYYYRYYTGETYEGETFVGFQHGLKRELLPEAYAKACDHFGTDDLGTIADDYEYNGKTLADFTCFYYKYDSNKRVTYEEVYGELRTTTFDYDEGYGDNDNTNLWTTKTVETRQDDSTFTVYTNYLKLPLLTDLYDPATGEHTFAYWEYDAVGNVELEAQSSAVEGYWDGYDKEVGSYSGDHPTDYGIHVTAAGSGLVNLYTYYLTSDDPSYDPYVDDSAGESTAGGVPNLRESAWVADGINDAYPDKVQEYTYYKHTYTDELYQSKYVYHLAEQTEYPTLGNGVTTSYDGTTFSWYNAQILCEKLILPAVTEPQNGSGTAAYTQTYYTTQGNVEWTEDELGNWTYYHYDSTNNRLDYVIQDCYGLHAQTDYTYDLRGRLVQTLGPEHLSPISYPLSPTLVRTASWTVYDDVGHVTYSAQGYAWLDEYSQWNYTLVNPVSIMITNKDGNVTEQIQAIAETTALDSDDPLSTIAADVLAQTNYTAWTTYQYQQKQLVATAVYFDIPETSSDPDADEFIGTQDVHYNVTQYGYDPLGRPEWTVTPGGTITFNLLDARGLTLSTWVGTDMVPSYNWNGDLDESQNPIYDWHDFEYWLRQPENADATEGPADTDMVCTASYEYDANGNVTQVTQHVDSDSDNDRITEYGYDWRNRLVTTLVDGGSGTTHVYTFTQYSYDNLDRNTQTENYSDTDGDLATTGDQKLLTKSTTAYDARGRVYQTSTYSVDITQTPSVVGDALTSNAWYDAAGNVIKQQAAGSDTFTKYVYDGLGRVTAEYVGYDADGESTDDLYDDYYGYVTLDLGDDTILQQTKYDYDESSSVIFLTTYERNHNATGTGVLSSSTARVSYTAYWCDGLGRQTAAADYGTNGGTAMTSYDRPDVAPESSDTVLVTLTAYNAAGLVESTTDPAEIVSKTFYNDAGWVARTVQNYIGSTGVYDSQYPDQNINTTYDYDSAGQLWKVTDTLGNVTEYQYDDWGRLEERIDPDPDGNPGTTDDVPHAYNGYNYLGELTDVTDPLGYVTTYEYDNLGRQIKVTQPDPDEPGSGEDPPYTETVYDVRGNIYQVKDALDHETTYEYNEWNRLITETDAEGGITRYIYDDLGRMTSLKDPTLNKTTWEYDRLNRVVEETNQLSATRYYTYSGGLLYRIVDRNLRARDFDYDRFGRQENEYWYANETAAEADLVDQVRDAADYSLTLTYDRLGRIDTVVDSDGTVYDYDYDDLGRATEIEQTFTGLTPTIYVTQQFDGAGNRKQLAAVLDTTDDFVNDYEYDNLGRMIWIKQDDGGGNAVAEKRVDFTYDVAGQWDTITRYADLDGVYDVATGTCTYDATGRLTGLAYEFSISSTDTPPEYTWDWDEGNRIEQFTSVRDALTGSYGTATYTNDDTNQLTDATYANWLNSPSETGEDYDYDANGNRTNNGFTVAEENNNNQMLTGAGFRYVYDDEGNRILRYVDEGDGQFGAGDTLITKYIWDHRCRLVEVIEYADHGDYLTETIDSSVEYVYDYQNRLLYKIFYDPDGDGGNPLQRQTSFVYDGNQIALQFDKTGSGAIADTDLSHRYLWGPAVDQILADETADNGGAEDVLWTLTDHLNTVRDLAVYDNSNDITDVVNHRVYDAFGNMTSEIDPNTEDDATLISLFGFTGKLFDRDTNLQNNINRWYEASTGKWLSEDPIGLLSKDINYYRYVKNKPLFYLDSSGLITEEQCLALKIEWINTLMYQQILKNCPGFRISCVFDPGIHPLLPGGDEGGAFLPEENRIKIVYNNINSITLARRILYHEMIHAYDKCVYKNTDRCWDWACTEVRAHSMSGTCDEGMPNRKGKSFEQCVMDSAAKSLRNTPCKPPDLWVTIVWPDCFLKECSGPPLKKWPLPAWPKPSYPVYEDPVWGPMPCGPIDFYSPESKKIDKLSDYKL